MDPLDDRGDALCAVAERGERHQDQRPGARRHSREIAAQREFAAIFRHGEGNRQAQQLALDRRAEDDLGDGKFPSV